MRNVNVLCLVIMYYTKIYTYVINLIPLRILRSCTVQLPLQHVKLNISVYYVIYDNLPLANADQIKISPCLNGARYVARSDVKISAVDRPEWRPRSRANFWETRMRDRQTRLFGLRCWIWICFNSAKWVTCEAKTRALWRANKRGSASESANETGECRSEMQHPLCSEAESALSADL